MILGHLLQHPENEVVFIAARATEGGEVSTSYDAGPTPLTAIPHSRAFLGCAGKDYVC